MKTKTNSSALERRSALKSPTAPKVANARTDRSRTTRVEFNDAERTTTYEESLFIRSHDPNEPESSGVYNVRIETANIVERGAAHAPDARIRIQWHSEYEDCGTENGEITFPIAGGPDGLEAFGMLVARVIAKCRALGDLDTAPPKG